MIDAGIRFKLTRYEAGVLVVQSIVYGMDEGAASAQEKCRSQHGLMDWLI